MAAVLALYLCDTKLIEPAGPKLNYVMDKTCANWQTVYWAEVKLGKFLTV